MESFPESVSPRRIAKPPLITQIVPNINPMSMTMPNALLMPSTKVAAKMGVNRSVVATSKVFIEPRLYCDLLALLFAGANNFQGCIG